MSFDFATAEDFAWTAGLKVEALVVYQLSASRVAVQDEALQPPAQPATRDLRPSRRWRSGVLAPYPSAPGVLITAHADQQRRGPVSERFVREPAQHRVPGDALAPALPTPQVRLNNSALDDRAIRRQMLPDSVKSKLIESAERGQIGRAKSRLRHVEIFRMGSVGNSTLRETPTPTRPGTRSDDFTLIREEPPYYCSRPELAWSAQYAHEHSSGARPIDRCAPLV